MITIDPLFSLDGGRTSDPVLMGVTRGLAQALSPAEPNDLPEHLAELVRRLMDRDGPAEG